MTNQQCWSKFQYYFGSIVKRRHFWVVVQKGNMLGKMGGNTTETCLWTSTNLTQKKTFFFEREEEKTYHIFENVYTYSIQHLLTDHNLLHLVVSFYWKQGILNFAPKPPKILLVFYLFCHISNRVFNLLFFQFEKFSFPH